MGEKKHIAFYIGSLSKGGAERVFVNLAKYFLSRGYRVTMVTQYKREKEYDLPDGAARVISDLTESETGGRIGNFFRRCAKLRRIFKEIRADLVLSAIGKNNFMAILANAFLPTKVVVSVVADPREEYPNPLMRFLADTLFFFADGIVMQTREAVRFFPPALRKRCVILQNSLNPAFVRPRYEGERRQDIVAVGRLDENKNQKMILDAFAKLSGRYPESRLFLYGDGPLKGRLEGQAKELGLADRVFLPGTVSDVPERIGQAYAFVLASYTEGMPNTLLEAMSLGLACISTDCPSGGPRDLIEDGKNGFLIPTGDTQALADRLDCLLADPKRMQAMGREAARLQESYRPKQVNARWEAYFGEIMERPKRNRDGIWAVLWTALFLAGLAPVFLLASYSFPCADDYGFSAGARLAWIDTHSLTAVLAQAAGKAVQLWHSWQGTFSSIFLMALQPGIFGDRWYQLTPWIMTGALGGSVFYLFYVVLCRLLGAKKSTAVALWGIYMLIAVNTLVDKTQGLFWYNGAVHYMVPQAALFCLTGLVVQMAQGRQKKNRLRMVTAVILTVYIGGGNLVTGLECGIWLAFGFLAALWAGRARERKPSGDGVRLAVLFAVWAVFFGINALAPGNGVRQADFSYRPGAVLSVLESFYYCLDYVLGDWQNWAVWLFLPLCYPFVKEALRRYRGTFRFPCPLLVLALSFCVLSSMFTPSVYASGNPGAGRIFNIIYLTFLLLLLLNLLYLEGWRQCGRRDCQRQEDGGENLAAVKLGTLAAFLFCAALCAKAEPDFFTATAAVSSLRNGEAVSYRARQEERNAMLLDDSVQDVVLEAFDSPPPLLFYEDIEADPGNWKNVRMSSYYRKDSVRLGKK